jgi:putative transposase
LRRQDAENGRTFSNWDRELDRAGFGPVCLRQPAVAEVATHIIEAAGAERQFCKLQAFVVMPNHVHLLITPRRPLSEVTKWIKGASARSANQILNRTGRPFWQDESFDHWVRSQAEFAKIERYIVNNPVRAGLVAEPHQWRYSTPGRHRLNACATGQAPVPLVRL